MTLVCPMHSHPYPECDENGVCPMCGRCWSIDADGNMRTATRRVRVVGPIEPGADINAVIKPLEGKS